MARTLIRGALAVVTMDDQRREIAGGDVLIDGGVIVAVGTDLPRDGAHVVEAGGCVVTPGLVNTHHHLFQTLTRAVPAAQDAALFGWLRTLYPIWSRMTPGDIRASARLGLAELALSGCTCSSDHLYLFPNGARLDDSIEAAADIGIRFTATRGSMSIGESKGGLPPTRWSRTRTRSCATASGSWAPFTTRAPARWCRWRSPPARPSRSAAS